MPNYKLTIEQVDNILPQTQCGACGYAGCLPYARAMVNQDESIAKCPPGGIPVLKKLGQLFEQDIESSIPLLQAQMKPKAVAFIRPDECIGCTKCIQACPVDAIIGSTKKMHYIINAECTGCELCIAPCPVDCIEMHAVDDLSYQSEQAKKRYIAKQQRKQKSQFAEIDEKQNKKAIIQAALARVKAKKQLGNANG